MFNSFRSARGATTFQVPRDEDAYEMERAKPRQLWASLGYLGQRLGKAVFRPTSVLKFHLNAAWLFRRLAHETSIDVYGEDYVCNSAGLDDETLQRWIPPGGTVVDIGCGVGRWSRRAAKWASSVVGIDYDDANLDIARSRTSEPNVTYRSGDVTRDLAGTTFDVGLLIHVVEHISNPEAFLRELKSVCRTLVVEVPDFEADPLNLVRMNARVPYHSDGDHVREYTSALLEAQLSRAGWALLSIERKRGSILALAHVAESAASHRP